MRRLSELEAVNRMLLGIRLAPVQSLEDVTTYTEAYIAKMVLNQEILKVQAQGWNYNTRALTLGPEANGTIPVPSGTIDVYVPQGHPEVLIDCDDRLMEAATGNKEFNRSLFVYTVVGFKWEQLPMTIQMLCLAKACLAFKTEMKSEVGPADAVSMEAIARAEADAKAWDLRQKRVSVLDTLSMRRHLSVNRPRY